MGALLLKLALGGFNILKMIDAALMRFFKALNLQGWLGMVAAIVLALGWLHAHGEERHWKKQSGQFEKLYHNEQTAFATTVANYRTAAEKARALDAANAARVKTEQTAINERTSHDYEARIADARARAAAAERLRTRATAANSSAGGTASVPGIRAPATGPAETAGEGGLPASDALTATEQAIQLDELIKWVKQQAGVDTNR